MKRLAGRRIAVTGAASGIGRATALRFVAEGAQIAAIDLNGEGLDALRAEAPGVEAFCCDITDHGAAGAMLAKIAGMFGGLDGLVNCAGIDRILPFSESDGELWSRMFEVNVTAPMMLCRAALDLLETPAAIVNISSGAGLRPLDGRSAYCASKAALLMATRVLALELAPWSIRVNALCPGVIDTPMLRRGWETAADPEAAYQEIVSRNAMRQIGTPESIAAGVLYLMSCEADFVTGATLSVDGGRAFH